MTGSFQCHSIDSSGPILPSKELETSKVNSGRIAPVSQKDTLAPSAQRDIALSQDARIPLPKGTTNYLSTLTDAFAEVYQMMSKSVISQIGEQNKLQDLDQTMSQIVMDSTNNALAKQQDLLEKSTEMQKEYNDKADEAKQWQTIAEVVGVAVLIVSIGVSIATWGAAAPAAEMAAVELTEVAASGAESSLGAGAEMADIGSDIGLESEAEGSEFSEGVSDASDSELSNTDSEIEESESPEYMRETREMMSRESNPSVNEQMNEQVADDLEESDQAVNNTTPKWQNLLRRLSRSVIGGATGTVYAMPHIYQAQASFFQAQYKTEVAELLKKIGPLMGTMQENEMYFQFYQKLVQRGSGFVQQLIEESGEAVEIDGSLMSAYRQLAVSLAHAV